MIRFRFRLWVRPKKQRLKGLGRAGHFSLTLTHRCSPVGRFGPCGPVAASRGPPHSLQLRARADDTATGQRIAPCLLRWLHKARGQTSCHMSHSVAVCKGLWQRTAPLLWWRLGAYIIQVQILSPTRLKRGLSLLRDHWHGRFKRGLNV